MNKLEELKIKKDMILDKHIKITTRDWEVKSGGSREKKETALDYMLEVEDKGIYDEIEQIESIKKRGN